MWVTKLFNAKREVDLNPGKVPVFDFYSLRATDIDGGIIEFSSFRGKKVLLVNTASDCGYTAQYDQLEKLWRKYQQQLIVIAFPSNDFKEQEKGDATAIAAFCRKNYGVSFPVMEKSVVLTGEGQHPVYRWLTGADQNGWNKRPPSWNFSKYLVDEQGNLRAYLGPSVSPMEDKMFRLIE